ncbi:MAG: hypothetical protein ACRBCT_04035 [Alphaproteobacteria bacterium]
MMKKLFFTFVVLVFVFLGFDDIKQSYHQTLYEKYSDKLSSMQNSSLSNQIIVGAYASQIMLTPFIISDDLQEKCPSASPYYSGVESYRKDFVAYVELFISFEMYLSAEEREVFQKYRRNLSAYKRLNSEKLKKDFLNSYADSSNDTCKFFLSMLEKEYSAKQFELVKNNLDQSIEKLREFNE